MGYPSYITDSEPAWLNMPESLKQELMLYIQSYDPPAEGELDGPCIWYDSARRCCKHHKHRPQVCRDFTVGGKGCIEWRSHYRMQHPHYLP